MSVRRAVGWDMQGYWYRRAAQLLLAGDTDALLTAQMVGKVITEPRKSLARNQQ